MHDAIVDAMRQVVVLATKRFIVNKDTKLGARYQDNPTTASHLDVESHQKQTRLYPLKYLFLCKYL